MRLPLQRLPEARVGADPGHHERLLHLARVGRTVICLAAATLVT
jgi:hypothetical protein